MGTHQSDLKAAQEAAVVKVEKAEADALVVAALTSVKTALTEARFAKVEVSTGIEKVVASKVISATEAADAAALKAVKAAAEAVRLEKIAASESIAAALAAEAEAVEALVNKEKSS